MLPAVRKLGEFLIGPPLTTVSLPSSEMGVEAMTMLRQVIAGHTPTPLRRVLDTPLVTGNSCGCRTP